MNKRITSIKEFKGRNQPQELTITTVSATLGNATRAVMYNGKIVIDMKTANRFTIGGITHPIRIIDGSFLARTSNGDTALTVYKGATLTDSAGYFTRPSASFKGISRQCLTTTPNRFTPLSLTNCIITGSQITIGAKKDEGAGIITLDYEPYEL